MLCLAHRSKRQAISGKNNVTAHTREIEWRLAAAEYDKAASAVPGSAIHRKN